MKLPAEYEKFTVIAIENPRWSDRENIRIDVDLTLQFPSVDPETDGPIETMPFTSCPFDTFGPHCPDIFEHAAAMTVGPWQRPEVTVEDLQADLDKLMPDIVLGLADESTIELAKSLRIQIKAMS